MHGVVCLDADPRSIFVQYDSMRTLLFDIDGTLLLTNRGGGRALIQAIREEFEVSDVRMDIRFSGRTDRSLLIEILERNGLPTSEESQNRLGQIYTGLLPNVLKRHGGRVLPGAIDLLERISTETELRCYVMTGNLHETATHKLDHFGLSHYFRGVFGGDHDRQRDDLARRTADALRDRYGESATDDVVVIGDTPADIRCGHAIGAKVVAVCTGSHERAELESESPMVVLNDMSNVSTIFDLLTGANGAATSQT
jgi:phosphoglycolate phosphatase